MAVLIDTSLWIDHLHSPIPEFLELLDREAVLVHPFVIGELAMGSLKERAIFLQRLQRLPAVILATEEQVLGMVETEALYGLGVGYVDAHLLASTRLTQNARLWTRDRRLGHVAEVFGLHHVPR